MPDQPQQPDQTPVQQPQRLDCTFCGYQIPANVSPVGDLEQPFCSDPCREAFEDDQAPFRDGLAFKQRPVDVAALQPGLPEGIPGNAAVLFAGQEGTKREGVLIEWLWRELQYGGQAVMICVDEPPSVFVDSFLAHGWNVLPYLHERDLVLVDMFTSRLEDEAAFTKRNDRWNSFVEEAFDRGFLGIRDPSDLRTVSNQLDNLLEDLEMTDGGVVAINSLTELASFTQEVQAVNFLKENRAIVCKSRYVPLLTAASVPREDDLYPTDYPHDHEYLFDGIVDLEVNEELADGKRVDRLSVRKMEDALVVSDWIPYEFRPGAGYVPVSLPVDQDDGDQWSQPVPGFGPAVGQQPPTAVGQQPPGDVGQQPPTDGGLAPPNDGSLTGSAPQERTAPAPSGRTGPDSPPPRQ